MLVERLVYDFVDDSPKKEKKKDGKKKGESEKKVFYDLINLTTSSH